MKWTVEESGACVLVRVEGRFDVSAHARLLEDIISRPYWRPGRHLLGDLRGLSFEGTRYADVGAAVATHRDLDAQFGGGRAALVVSSLENYGMGRMFEGATSAGVSVRLGVFMDEGEARQWLEGGE